MYVCVEILCWWEFNVFVVNVYLLVFVMFCILFEGKLIEYDGDFFFDMTFIVFFDKWLQKKLKKRFKGGFLVM